MTWRTSSLALNPADVETTKKKKENESMTRLHPANLELTACVRESWNQFKALTQTVKVIIKAQGGATKYLI